MQLNAIKSLLSALVISASMATANAATILNGNFEGAVTPTPGGGNVPVGWTANTAYGATDFNQVLAGQGINGASPALSIGNDDNQFPQPATLSQTFSDTAKTVYTVDFFWRVSGAGDPNAFLTLAVGGSFVTIPEPASLVGGSTPFVEDSFTFTGTGSDTLSISAQTNPGDFFVDNISLSTVTSAVPEPSTWAMMILGFFGLGFMAYRRKSGMALNAA
jgi:PEP-CTERM motif